MHEDKDGKELREGFYINFEPGGSVVYFTGVYYGENDALTEGYLTTCTYPKSDTSKWKRIEDPQKYFEAARKNLEWMQQKLPGLEQIAKEANLSARRLDDEDWGPSWKKPLQTRWRSSPP